MPTKFVRLKGIGRALRISSNRIHLLYYHWCQSILGSMVSFEVLCFYIFCQNQEYCTSCKQCLSFLHRTSLLQIQEGTVCISCIPHLKLGYTGVFHTRHHDSESKACMSSYETRERRMYLPCIVCSGWLHFEDKRMNVPQDIFGRDKWFEASDVLQFYSATKM